MRSAAILSLIAAASATTSEVFLTTFNAALLNGDFGKAAADAICDAESGNTGFAALLGTDGGVSPFNLITGDDVVNSFGGVLLGNKATFFGGEINGNINQQIDLFDSTFASGPVSIWTGMTELGANSNTCSDWSSNSDQQEGNFAQGSITTLGQYLEAGQLDCNLNVGRVYCYRNTPVSSGNLDPHFYGFNGEQLDIEHDDNSADRAFSIFCNTDIEFNTMFSATPEGLLYMTRFWVRVGDVKMTWGINDAQPTVLAGEYEKSFVANVNRTRLSFEDVTVEFSNTRTYVKFGELRLNFAQSELNGDQFLNFDIVSENFERYPAGGLVGRTMMNKLTEAEFADYTSFVLPEAEEYFYAVCHV